MSSTFVLRQRGTGHYYKEVTDERAKFAPGALLLCVGRRDAKHYTDEATASAAARGLAAWATEPFTVEAVPVAAKAGE